MRVATWNVNSLRPRMGLVLDWLNIRKPDILCLQETRVTNDQFPNDAFKSAGYESVFHGQVKGNGVAVLSRSAISDVNTEMGDYNCDQDARFISCTIQGVRIVNVYVPYGKRLYSKESVYKKRWLMELRNFINVTYAADDALILAGDFNIIPRDQDAVGRIGKRNVYTHKSMRALLDQILDFGLEDAFARQNPDLLKYSWHAYPTTDPSNERRRLRIDLLLASQVVAGKISYAAIDDMERDKNNSSDHVPVYIDFDL